MILNKKDILLGFIHAKGGCLLYKMLIDKIFFLSDTRIHHYHLGLGIILYGIAEDSSYWIGFGLGLFFDDIKDFIDDSDRMIKELKKLVN